MTQLEKFRRIRGWSQAELARQARLHPSRFHVTRQGGGNPLRARAKLAAALGVPEDILFAPDGTLLEEREDT